MRFHRKVAVLEDLRRPRLGERQEREARDLVRPRRSSALQVVATAGMSFKGDGPEVAPRAVQTHKEGGSE